MERDGGIDISRAREEERSLADAEYHMFTKPCNTTHHSHWSVISRDLDMSL